MTLTTDVTIGDGTTSTGTHNLTSYPGTYELVTAALEDGGGSARFLPGTFPPPERTIELEEDDQLVGPPRARIFAEARPAFCLSGSGGVLAGFSIIARGLGCCAVVHLHDFEQATIRDLRLRPTRGWDALGAQDGRDLDINGCRVCPERMDGATQAEVGRAISLHDVELTTVRGCGFMRLGSSDFPVEAIIYSLVSTGVEGGHLAFLGNRIERIVRGENGRLVEMDGGRFVAFAGNVIGRALGAKPAFRFSNHAGPIAISGNDIHNCGAPVVEFIDTDGVAVVGNAFALLPPGTPPGGAVSVDASSTGAVVANNSEGM